MRHEISQLAGRVINHYGPFYSGFIAAVLLLLFLLICYGIFQMLSRKRIREITESVPHGSLVITANAISDMVQAVVCSKFKCMSIKKIMLWKNQHGTSMELYGTFDLDGGRLPDVANEMAEEILKNLDGQLGITSITSITPNIRKITGTASRRLPESQ